MGKTIFDVNWIDLIPASISGDANVKAISAAVSPQLQEVSAAIAECVLLARIDELDEQVLDLLAWQWHVDFYDLSLTLAKKRNLVRTAIKWHRKKGTKAAVQAMVSTVFSNGIVTEWFEYGGEPYYFRVETDEIISEAAAYDRLVKVIEAAKNKRSWLESVIVRRTWSGTTYFGAAQVFGKTLTLYPVAFTMETVTGPAYFGCAMHSGKLLSLEVS
ncbi:phage tail protein I [Anaeroselena agilis]|uniref:Phage tail protein I n=1 Tax=Anaeroselena agilis TaxID=3063788 RepID=A0ABU3P162_9FIRM|nr:phage tail protein I [Selenomonadales bacterium 4137-cl]